MTNKTDKQFFFETGLLWRTADTGIVSKKDTTDSIAVDTPEAFGGSGKAWSPEELFLAAVGSCFMATFIAFSKKYQLPFSGISCNTIGQIEIVEGKYKFTHINVFPKITIPEENHRNLANKVVERTHQACLISNSINADIIYHTEIIPI